MPPEVATEADFFRLIQVDIGIDFLQVSHHLLDVRPAYKAGGGADMMDYAALYFDWNCYNRA